MSAKKYLWINCHTELTLVRMLSLNHALIQFDLYRQLCRQNYIKLYQHYSLVISLPVYYSTDLQIALGVLLRDSNDLLSHFNDYQVTCSYGEILRLKKVSCCFSRQKLGSTGNIRVLDPFADINHHATCRKR